MKGPSWLERIVGVIHHQLPDRGPVALFFGSLPNFIPALHPELPGLDQLVKHSEVEPEYCRCIADFCWAQGADLTSRPNWNRPSVVLMGFSRQSALTCHTRRARASEVGQ